MYCKCTIYDFTLAILYLEKKVRIENNQFIYIDEMYTVYKIV